MSTKITTATPPTKLNKEQGCHSNTDLCVDLKTILRNDRIAKTGKNYPGVLTHDKAYHYTFVETLPSTTGKRNPHVFIGKYITVTRRDDGSLQPNFKTLKEDANFSPIAYINGVANELHRAFESLLEKEGAD